MAFPRRKLSHSLRLLLWSLAGVLLFCLVYPSFQPMLRRQFLIQAVNNKDDASVRKLLRAGASPNATVSSGTPLLHSAIESGDIEVVRALLDYGASPNIRSDWAASALSVAVS